MKTGKLEEKLSQQGENQTQTQPAEGTGPESNPGHVGGRQALSHVRQPWFSKYAIFYLQEYPFIFSIIYGPTYRKWLQNVSICLTFLCLSRKDAFLSAKNL